VSNPGGIVANIIQHLMVSSVHVQGGMPSDSDGPIRLVDIIAGMASRLRSIGEAILQTGVGFRNFLGQLLLDMGHSLRSFMWTTSPSTPQ